MPRKKVKKKGSFLERFMKKTPRYDDFDDVEEAYLDEEDDGYYDTLDDEIDDELFGGSKKAPVR